MEIALMNLVIQFIPSFIKISFHDGYYTENGYSTSGADARAVRPYVPTDNGILHDMKLKCINI